jgi:signal transduction histidine kinase
MQFVRRGVSFRAMKQRARYARFRKVLDRYGDYVLASALSLFVLSDVWTNDWIIGSRPLFSVTSLCMTVPLAWRRRAPFAVALTVAAALLVQVVLEPSPHAVDPQFLVWIVTSYSVAAHADLARAAVGLSLLIVAVDLWAHYTGDDLVFVPVILVGFWIAGRVVRSRNVIAAQLVERTRELEQERNDTARLAVAEERTRIARELHDIVAHTLGVMVVQAGAERMHEEPGTSAHAALSSIERSGRQALGEMGRLVGVLRTEVESDSLGPQPGLDQLETLIGRVRETGLEVELLVEGTPHDLAPGLDVSAYRIVQEALTNTLRHARSRTARVRLRWEPGTLHIEVTDDGIGPPGETGHAGHGLLGIRERVALFGGALVTGRSESGGYLLAATLPTSS